MAVGQYCNTSCALSLCIHLLLFSACLWYHYCHQTLENPSRPLHVLAAAAKATTYVLNLDVLLILISTCQHLALILKQRLGVSLWRTETLGQTRRLSYWCLGVFSALHVILTEIILGIGSLRADHGVRKHLKLDVGTAFGLSGYALVLLVILLLARTMFGTATTRKHLSTLYVPILISIWSIHVGFSGPRSLGLSDSHVITWICSLCAVFIYSAEMIYGQVRAMTRCASSILKVIEHPGEVVEVHISKDDCVPRAGQVRYNFPVWVLLTAKVEH